MSSRPNILLITTDQQRWDALGANGNPHIHTPNLDKLAENGVNFEQCYVQNPLCMPSRVSFLTGQYPSTLGITHMGVPVPEETVTLPTILSQYGYTSANFGKLHFQPHANRDHREPHPRYGFDQLEISDEPGVYEDAYRAWVRRKAPDQLDYLSVGLPPATAVYHQTLEIDDPVTHPSPDLRDDFIGAIPFPGDDTVTHAAFVAERTIDFLQQQDGKQPFLCIAAFYSPHAPWVVPQRYLDLYEPTSFTIHNSPFTIHNLSPVHGYYAMVSEVDHYVGEILQTLEAQGLADNTIIVFTSDHGEWLGDNGRFGKGYPGDDAVTRVPLIIKLPKIEEQRLKRGQVSASIFNYQSSIIEAVDVLPTLLDLVGIQIPAHVNGRSLLRTTECTKKSALTEFAGWKTLRTPSHRYLIHTDGSERLWDDANQQLNPADHPEVISEHRHLLLQRILDAERPLPRTWPY
ncbi:MAG: sulfatase-like hydrolase/transferase [Anaerolineae bacterium]|nr:sulfatase-like hydrolase/transferase [Anaerolineae bacterium]